MKIDPRLLLAALDERRTALATLAGRDKPLNWVEVSAQTGTYPALFTRIKNGSVPDGPNLTKLTTWLNRDVAEFEGCSACPDTVVASLHGSTDLPVAPRDHAWDGPAAKTRVFEAATDEDGAVDTEMIARAFLWRHDDADATTQAAWSLGFADIIDGTLTIVPAGVFATAGGRGVGAVDGLSDDDRDAIESRICDLYEHVSNALDDDFPCPFDDDTDSDDSDDSDSDAATASAGAEAKGTAAIVATGGHLHESEDPETQAAINRVRELFAEGVARVSIGASMDSEKMPDKDLLDELVAAEQWEEAEALLADVPFLIQHLAIVDTPAFVKANPTLDDDGQITGPITFEGLWTGDMRFFPLNGFTWEAALPIPIIWNRDAGDHTGTIVGSITGIERIEGETSQPDDAVAASLGVAGLDVIPAKYVRKPKPGPLTVTPPDENGLRHIFGTAAPAGVCHPNPKYSTQCFTYPGDADPQMRRFNSGMPRKLDDGSTIRLGALTMFGLHASTESMMRPGVTSTELAKYEDGRTIFAAVRGYDDPSGMLVAGIVMPDVSDAELQRALTMGSSVEMAPTRTGRNVVGAHLVPTQAWPVAAGGHAMTGPEPIQLAAEPEPDPEPQVLNITQVIEGGGEELAAFLSGVQESLARVETALALVAGKVLDFPDLPDLPEDVPEVDPAE